MKYAYNNNIVIHIFYIKNDMATLGEFPISIFYIIAFLSNGWRLCQWL